MSNSSSKIFFLRDGQDSLTELTEANYANEDLLQELLARYCDLLPGDQIDPDSPRRWLLISREMAVPDSLGGGDRWSLDHLFLDQDATPTFVECKRSSDTRGRREVVAQMLDYAANAVEYWNIERLRQSAAETASRAGKSLDREILNLLQSELETDVEPFWAKVESNLKASRVRLIFVADEIPKELRRLVEFLNAQMPNIEVLAVEVKQYLGVGGKALVPRVLGQTIPKAVLETTRRSTTRAEFFSRCTPFAGRFFTRVLDEAEKAGFAVSWTSGFAIKAKWNDRFTSFLFGYTVGGERIEVYLRDQSLTESELANWQQELRAFPCLQAAGRFTLRAQIREEMEGSLFEAIRAVFEKMRQLAEQRSADKIS